MILVLVAFCLPANSVMRAEDGTLLGNSPFMEEIIPIITVLFFVPSVVYGHMTGVYHGEKDACNAMGRAMGTMSSYIALTFVAAQFINFFGYTKLGTILALKGAEFFRNSGIGTLPTMILFVLFAAFINLFMGSASAKWALIAPVFVPMFMLLGYTPEFAQVAYRIGDSCTNVITPMMSYEVYLYVQKEAIKEDTKMGKEVCAALAEAKVQIKEYAEFLQDVAALKNKKILLERKKASFAVCESIDASCRIIDEMNPCATMKAVKNATEIENMRKAHLKDGIAVTKFMYWLKHTIGTCDMTEMTAAHKIEELRAEQGNYIEPSFVTIAAYKENAAMCYYHPSDEVCKELKPEGLLLVDSGGQYLEGTTDITRTYALGPLTEKEKEYYTIVAAAMLKVSTMKFLHGCRGINLDYTIREAFWKRGLDFAHGTGHSVGYLSNVHERPNGLRWKVVPERQDSAVIESGMICSDEPGLYFAGDFGTRTENLILCVEDEKNEYGQFLKFEFLTKAPIDLEALDTRFMDDADIERLNTYHKDVYETISPYMNDEEKEWLKHVTREISR